MRHSPVAFVRARRHAHSRVLRGDAGATSSEYLVIAGLMVAAIISLLGVFRPQLTTAITNLGCRIGAAVGNTAGGCGSGGPANAGASAGAPTGGASPLGLAPAGPPTGGPFPAGPAGGAGTLTAGGPGAAPGAAGGASPGPPGAPPMPRGFWGTLGDVGSELYWDSGYGTGTSLHTTTAGYGNWVGQGWSGGSEIPDKVGALPPTDALDALAQAHDFGYAIADEAGRLYGEAERNRLLALADAIAYNEFQRLPQDPRAWVPPPSDLEAAARYRDRFPITMQGMAWSHDRAMRNAPPPTPQQAAALAADGQMGPAQLQAEVNRRVQVWNADRGRGMRSRGGWK